jgi:hypothetical protein
MTNPYEAPLESALPPPRSPWKTAFQRGLIATALGFVFTQGIVVAANHYSFELNYPTAHGVLGRAGVVLTVAGLLSTIVAAVVLMVSWLAKRRGS